MYLEIEHTVSQRTLWQRGKEWELVNHSVVLVGWGISEDESEIPSQDLTRNND